MYIIQNTKLPDERNKTQEAKCNDDQYANKKFLCKRATTLGKSIA